MPILVRVSLNLVNEAEKAAFERAMESFRHALLGVEAIKARRIDIDEQWSEVQLPLEP